MQDIQYGFVRLEKIILHNYGIFKGTHDFVLEPHRTIIQGDSGTGKTTIVNALAKLGPVPGVMTNISAKSSEMFVKVITKGDRSLVQKFKSIIFVSDECSRFFPDALLKLQEGFTNSQKAMIRNETKHIFSTLLKDKPCKLEIYKNLDPSVLNSMALGEKVCYYYASVFAIRKVLGLDLPIVFDGPYACFDLPLRQGVRAFLEKQECQQILFGSEVELQEDGEPNYILNREN